MVSTPPKVNTHNDSNDKVNIMSPYQDFSQYIDSSSPQVKSGDYDDYFYDIDILTGNDIFHAEHQSYEISPELASSMTTPSLILDGISTPRDINDSPLFNHFVASPSLDPALGFFPDLTDPSVVAAARRSLMQQIPIPPSLTIPVDDTTPLATIQDSSTVSPTLSPALNIPWNPETAGPSSTDDLLQNTSSLSPLSPHTSTFSDNNTANNSPKSSTSNISPTINKLNTRNRKRSNEEIDKDPQAVADELALKRAKNTDAARRSRLRRVMKMESLEKQVTNLKNENNDLQTRIAVLESEKKGLEDKYAEKDSRVNMLEQQLSEAHERLVKRSRE